MKFTFLVAALSLLSFGSIAGELDGKRFCRTVGVSQHSGEERRHCLYFHNDLMRDNRKTRLSNPSAETINYVLVSGKILVVRDGKLESNYSVNSDLDRIVNQAGRELLLDN